MPPSTETCLPVASPGSPSSPAGLRSGSTCSPSCETLLQVTRQRWLVRHIRTGMYLRSQTSPFWTAWPEVAFQSMTPEHAYEVAAGILTGPGWQQVTELVQLTFERPAADPSTEWLHAA